jgi:hypothetical protein
LDGVADGGQGGGLKAGNGDALQYRVDEEAVAAHGYGHEDENTKGCNELELVSGTYHKLEASKKRPLS